MSTAFHAKRIVQAWEYLDFSRFEAELDSALCRSNRSAAGSEVEREQRAILESVLHEIRALGNDDDDSYRLGAGLFLLRHLQAR